MGIANINVVLVSITTITLSIILGFIAGYFYDYKE